MSCSTSGRKPRSSISSASSSTSPRTFDRSRSPRRMRSSRRPGVPTTTSTSPVRSASICGSSALPPYTARTPTPFLLPAFWRSPATCTHSSRVGTMTRTCTPVSVARLRRWSIGRPKPSVLPVPVRAWPMMSAPWSARPRVSSWMGKGEMMPCSVSASTSSGTRPRSANVVVSPAVGVAVVMVSLRVGAVPLARGARQE